jgi:DNA repair ATPase RecN
LIKGEHEEIAEVLAELRNSLSDTDRDRDLVDELVTRLRELVEIHFRHEEHNGYLKDALERAPRLAGQADILIEQHEALLEEIEKLRILVHSGVESPSWWSRIESDFHKFASRLISHEHSEVKLVQEAFTVDIGTAD